MFEGATSANLDVSNWDVSNVKNMKRMLQESADIDFPSRNPSETAFLRVLDAFRYFAVICPQRVLKRQSRRNLTHLIHSPEQRDRKSVV